MVHQGVCLGAGAFSLVTGVVSLQAADLPLVTGVVPFGTVVISTVAAKAPREPVLGVVETVNYLFSLKMNNRDTNKQAKFLALAHRQGA